MFPNFKSLSDKERKRQALLKQIERDQAIERAKQRAYSETLWASDIAKGKIDIAKSKTTTEAQTDASGSSGSSTASSSVFSLNPSTSDIGAPMSSSTQTRIMRTDRSIQTRPSMSDMTTSMDEPLRSENDMMRDEDYRSGFMRYEDRMWEQKDDLRKQGNIISKQRNEIKGLNHQIDSMNVSFHNAKIQYDRLVGENQYSNKQMALMAKEFEAGRQLYLNLRAAAETIQYERDITKHELEDLKIDYARGTELYETLAEGYKALNGEASKRILDYERIIENLKEENATSTARILEQQQQLLKTSVSEATSRNTRSQKNTPQALREFMKERGIEEAPVATPFGRVSKKILVVIKDGKLHKRQNNKPDINLEDGSRLATEALTGMDPVWTMVAISHTIEAGTAMANNSLYKQEAEAIRNSGKLLTHDEANELKQRQGTPRKNLPALYNPTTPTEKRDRGNSFYNNVSPVKEEKKKLKSIPDDGSGDVDMNRGMGLHGKILTGRGLRGAGRSTANLRHATGASAYDYKPIGSKYIRLPDLHSNILNLKQPNRSSIGKKQRISPELSKVIKDLVYDYDINQQLYEKLSITEKNIFTDILKITHLQWQFKDGWKDPNDRLIAEFDKLRGQVALGNNNPQMLKELKAMTVDLYSQKLITDDVFKEVFLSFT